MRSDGPTWSFGGGTHTGHDQRYHGMMYGVEALIDAPEGVVVTELYLVHHLFDERVLKATFAILWLWAGISIVIYKRQRRRS